MTQFTEEMVERAMRAAYHSTPRNKPFESLSAFQHGKLKSEVSAALTAALGDTYTPVDAKMFTDLHKRVVEIDEQIARLSPRGEQFIERQVAAIRHANWAIISGMIRSVAATGSQG